AMQWAASTLPDVPFHLMFQYVPDYRASGDPLLGRSLTREEIDHARAMAAEIGVGLYEEGGPGDRLAPVRPGGEAIGETVDILVHDDGRVSFTRLLDDLLPVAASLAPTDSRVIGRMEERKA